MIPQEIKEHPYWCVRKDKVPYNPKTGNMAKPNDPKTFGTYEEAAAVVEKYHGFGVSLGEGLSAVDIDHCIIDAKLSPMAQAVIDYFQSYTEISPSGAGIRILFYSHGVTYDKERYYFKNSKIGLELYLSHQTDRYVTVTGNEHPQSYPIRALTQDEVNNFAEQYMKRPEKKKKPQSQKKPKCSLSDMEILDKAMDSKNGDLFTALFNGDWQRQYQSQSEADLAFCNLLGFWCGCEYVKMDGIFRQSGLYRPKWDENHGGKTYGEITITKAIDNCMDTYEGYKQKNDGRTEPPKEKKSLNTLSAVELQKKEIPPVRFIVEGLLPQGLALLASPPKYGKSWFVLDLCIAVARGEPFLNHNSNQCGCLYLALEDSYNRLKTRMMKLLQNTPAPVGFNFAIKVDGLGSGLIEMLDNYMAENPDTALIVIDTLQKVRTSVNSKEGAYQSDYREVGELKAFGDKHGICILLVHHLRKAGDDADPFNRISGTNGIGGAADTSMVMAKKTRADTKTTLSITGRDIDYCDTVIRFNKDLCRWEFVGSLEEQEAMCQKEEYQQNPIVITVKELLKDSPCGWQGTASDLLLACADKTGLTVGSPRSISAKVKDIRHLFMAYDNIIYEAPTNTKRIHTFSCGQTPLF
ncbi:MAG: AAA family ATPase [Clostridiales bacterium]